MDRFPQEWICTSEGTLKLSDIEFLVRCPYDKSHRIINHRYSTHLLKCRTNYEVMKEAKNEKPQMSSCKYNGKHKVHAPELLYHEHNCPDKMMDEGENSSALRAMRGVIKEILHVLLENDNGGDQHEAKSEAAAKTVPKSEEEIVKAVTELLLDGSNKFGYKVMPSDIKLVSKQIKTVVKDVRRSQKVSEEIPLSDLTICKESEKDKREVAPVRYFSQTEDPDSFGYDRRTKWYHRRDILRCANKALPPPNAPKDDDDNWNLNASGPVFDWLQHQRNLKGPLRIYPPGLTKAQRRAFEITNTERLKYEEGIFNEEEPEKPDSNKKVEPKK